MDHRNPRSETGAGTQGPYRAFKHGARPTEVDYAAFRHDFYMGVLGLIIMGFSTHDLGSPIPCVLGNPCKTGGGIDDYPILMPLKPQLILCPCIHGQARGHCKFKYV